MIKGIGIFFLVPHSTFHSLLMQSLPIDTEIWGSYVGNTSLLGRHKSTHKKLGQIEVSVAGEITERSSSNITRGKPQW